MGQNQASLKDEVEVGRCSRRSSTQTAKASLCQGYCGRPGYNKLFSRLQEASWEGHIWGGKHNEKKKGEPISLKKNNKDAKGGGYVFLIHRGRRNGRGQIVQGGRSNKTRKGIL